MFSVNVFDADINNKSCVANYMAFIPMAVCFDSTKAHKHHFML